MFVVGGFAVAGAYLLSDEMQAEGPSQLTKIVTTITTVSFLFLLFITSSVHLQPAPCGPTAPVRSEG